MVLASGGITLYLSQKQEVVSIDNSNGRLPAQSGDMRALPVDHYFENGTHTYKGILTVPTPCHEILSQVTVMESYPEQVTIDLKEQGASNFCAQVITQTPFEVSFQASKDARISVRLNGTPASFKVTDLPAQQQAGKSNTKNPASVIGTTTPQIPDDSFLYEGSGAQ